MCNVVIIIVVYVEYNKFVNKNLLLQQLVDMWFIYK